MSSLRYAIAIPSSGGKTTLATSNPQFFVDIDRIFTLRPIPALWNYMNHEILRRSNCHETVPHTTVIELQSRMKNFDGPGRCLLTHSITAAEASGLIVLGALVPSQKIHEQAMLESNRNEIARWFAYRNAQVLHEQATQKGIPVFPYKNFDEFDEAVNVMVPEIQKLGHRTTNVKRSQEVWVGVPFEELRDDEELLLQLCTTATGCEFDMLGLPEVYPRDDESVFDYKKHVLTQQTEIESVTVDPVAIRA